MAPALFSCGAPAVPTYHADIAPFLSQSCVQCHADASDGRPLLTSYETARRNASRAESALERGIMPPFRIDRSGACGDFRGPRAVTDHDIDMFAQWVAAGTPEGTRESHPQYQPPPGVSGARVVSVGPSEPYLPVATDSDNDDHRCFLVDPSLDRDAVLTGYEVVPGVPRLVHHVMLFTLAADEVVLRAQAADAAQTGPGWSCPGMPLDSGVSLAGVWVPGDSRLAFPTESGVTLPARPLVIQIHYRVESGSQADQTTLRLELTDDVDLHLSFVPFALANFVLPPGESAFSLHRTGQVQLGGDLTVVGVFPHMHSAGRSVRLTATTDNCLVEVPDWRYDWQEVAFYTNPLNLPAGTPLDLTCTWDTRGSSLPITWGEGTSDEMCTVFLLAAPVVAP